MENPVSQTFACPVVAISIDRRDRKPTMPRQFTIPGQGMAGTVVDVGANVTRFWPGQRVLA